ncbi:hypothetical protein J7I93_24240 [Bacillus sp. ISL-47]|uniref:hypothetical protein n=1 Tax=Bacillus sp. ISL-47 TaxID=2819130 RepID=UPI001BE718DA|nr:hypothetical protein [Bacillus sp. ISL-47]MBT2691249.1 hypothetical protein [Bacillus sp. ISL-47]MBT2708927.1 hypothetical protein [Pseudomonas sp. ISL-84]
MLQAIKEGSELYKKYFLRVILIGFTIILPIQAIYTLAINFIAMPFEVFNLSLWTSIFQSIFMLMSLFIILIPMISLASQGTRTNTVKTGQIYGDTIKYAFFAYLISIPFSVVTTIGLLLLIIPGIILLVLFIGIPFVKVIEDETVPMVIKRSVSFGKENFIVLFGMLLLFAAADFLGSYLFSYLAIIISGQMAALNWAMMIFNMFLLPLFVFSVAKLYFSWNGEADLLQEGEFQKQLEQYR